MKSNVTDTRFCYVLSAQQGAQSKATFGERSTLVCMIGKIQLQPEVKLYSIEEHDNVLGFSEGRHVPNILLRS